MAINGLPEGMTIGQLRTEVQQGAKFVIYEYCISILIMTFKRGSAVHYIRPGASAIGPAVPYILLSAVAGWWGFPWGFIYTPMALITNFGGGKDVTNEVLASMQ